MDEATGLYDYGVRYYDPAVARWGQIDPLVDQYASYSPYNYVLGNPVRLVDPDGMAPDDIIVLFYVVGTNDTDNQMFYNAALTRKNDIMDSSTFDPSKDIVIMQEIQDISDVNNLMCDIIDT